MSTEENLKSGGVSRRGLYLYGFCESGQPLPDGLAGLFDEPVREVEVGGLSALVSGVPSGRLRPERRHLSAHQTVLAKLTAVASVLPAGFGMVVPNERRLAALVDGERDSLVEQLERVRGRAEMSVRVSWDVPNIFAFLVESEPALRAARDAMLANEGNHQAKVAAGELFGKVIASHRAEHERRVVEALEPFADDVVVEPPKSEKEIVRLAALVRREAMGEFERALEQAASGFDGHFRFDYSGPWAPHSFVRLRISPDQAAEVA